MTALTPAQVREHARALIRWRALMGDMSIARFLLSADLVYSHEDFQDVHDAIYAAIRTARITVDWDEEGDVITPIPPTAEQCEDTFHRCLAAGDARGVAVALRALRALDPHRATALYDETLAPLDRKRSR